MAKGVEESKHKALRRLLNGLGIPHVGKKIAQDISKLLTSDNISKELTNKEFLVAIYGIGEKTVENMSKFFENKENIAILNLLKEAGINMDPHKYINNIDVDEVKGSFSIT
ncbi:MAG: helix-hairpin-helix domain-containing protein [bacterium]